MSNFHYQFPNSPPSFYSSSDDFNTQAQKSFDRFGDTVDSSMKWAVAESIGMYEHQYNYYSFSSMLGI